MKSLCIWDHPSQMHYCSSTHSVVVIKFHRFRIGERKLHGIH